MAMQVLASSSASLGQGGMLCPHVVLQLSCLMCNWLLPLTFSSQSLKPLYGHSPGPLGHLAGCCFWFCSLGTSEHLTSPAPALLLLSPTHPQGILTSVLLWILQNCFSPVPLSAVYFILFYVTLFFLALVVVTVPVQIPAALTAFLVSMTVVGHQVSAPSLS